MRTTVRIHIDLPLIRADAHCMPIYYIYPRRTRPRRGRTQKYDKAYTTPATDRDRRLRVRMRLPFYARGDSLTEIITFNSCSISASQNTTFFLVRPNEKYSNLPRHPAEVEAPEVCVVCRKDTGDPLECEKVCAWLTLDATTYHLLSFPPVPCH
jgi:hypothetical protein